MRPKFLALSATLLLLAACGSQPAASQPTDNLLAAATETTAAVPSEVAAFEAITFYTNRDDGDYEIYRMNPDGSDPINLTNIEGYDGQPSWSPDGTRIVFTSGRFGISEYPPADQEIYVMNADGSGIVRLTENQIPDSDAVWSPDGAMIAFTRLETHEQIFIMNADGSGLRNFTNDTFDNTNASWSPDGTRLAFASDREATDPLHSTDIFVMNLDGSGLTQLTTNTTFDNNPVWSPDGTKIAFNCDGEICVIKADGSNLRNVTNRPFSGEFVSGWSPDGTQLVLDSDMDTFGGEIYVLDLATGEVTRLTNNDSSDDSPVWLDIIPLS